MAEFVTGTKITAVHKERTGSNGVRSNVLLCLGDTITWTHCSRRGKSSVVYSTREAKIIYLDLQIVTVKYRGKLVNLRHDRVRKKGERTELTELIMRDQI